MSTNTSRIRRSSSMKNRRQALHRVTERTESRRQWPTPAEFARRVSPATAARRRCSVRAGHAAPGRAFKSPAPSRTPFSRCLGLSSSPQQPPSSRSPAIAIADASSPSLLLHPGSASTSAPATHCARPCPLTTLGKLQPRAPARRSLAAVLRYRGHAATVHLSLQ